MPGFRAYWGGRGFVSGTPGTKGKEGMGVVVYFGCQGLTRSGYAGFRVLWGRAQGSRALGHQEKF